jgi:Flp pilus assembly protein TadG
MATTLKRFNRDKRGATTVQAILFIPVFLTIIFGGLTLWQVLSVKRALHLATYEATRYLTFYPIDSREPAIWRNVARAVIEREMRYSELPGRLEVTVTIDGQPTCETRIEVKAVQVVNIELPFVSPLSLTLQDQHEGTILCGPG